MNEELIREIIEIWFKDNKDRSEEEAALKVGRV